MTLREGFRWSVDHIKIIDRYVNKSSEQVKTNAKTTA